MTSINRHLSFVFGALLASAGPAPADTQQDAAGAAELKQQLEELKREHGDELRKLRELDAKLKAMQVTQPGVSATPNASAGVDQQQALADASRASRSVEDLMQEEHALFTRRFTFEPSLSYARYDRSQLALNGFLALDAIFLGSIAVEGVSSDLLTLGMGMNYGVSKNLAFSLNAPFVQRNTNYTKGGVGGSAVATQETSVSSDFALGDVSFGMNYRLAAESAKSADLVLSVDLTSPTGKEPYGIPVRVIQKDPQGVTTFSVPDELPTGNGAWSAATALSFVKTVAPAILFGNVGYAHPLSASFDDIDADPNTQTPGEVKLGDSFSYGLGVAFALNEKTSLSLSFNHKLAQRAKSQADGGIEQTIVGSNANAANLNVGVTYGLTPTMSIATSLAAGLTEDASDFGWTVKLPMAF